MDEVGEKPWRSMARSRGAKLRSLREAQNLTQVALAQLAGSSQQTVDRLERGDVRDSSALTRIAEILGFEMGDSVLTQENVRHVKNWIEQPDAPVSENPFANMLQRLERIPVYAQGIIRPGHIDFEQVSNIVCPQPLMGVKDAYALLYSDFDMAPVFAPGDTLLIHPYLPVRPGSDVLYRSPEGRSMVRSCTFVGADHHRVKRWLPEAEADASYEDWPVRHSIVGRYLRT